MHAISQIILHVKIKELLPCKFIKILYKIHYENYI